MSSHHLPDSQAPTLPIVHGARWVGYIDRHPYLVEAISWLAWLLLVAAFAIWAHLYYQAPAAPRWLGLTIRTGVFAIWAQVAREWLVLFARRRARRQLDSYAAERTAAEPQRSQRTPR